MPWNMVINTSSPVGYNNLLLPASKGMKFELNGDVNKDKKDADLQVMDGETTKSVTANGHGVAGFQKQAELHSDKCRSKCRNSKSKNQLSYKLQKKFWSDWPKLESKEKGKHEGSSLNPSDNVQRNAD